MSINADSASPVVREPAGRQANQIRPLSLEIDVSKYAEGSVLVKAGNTHVLCTASVEESIPPWIKAQAAGDKSKLHGWITAEYSMLPRATHTRSKRDREKVSGRTQEIQRLIGRALRAMIDLKALGERSIMIDCDVLQADGGTRTASITGACVALAIAVHRTIESGKLVGRTFKEVCPDTVSAISIGMKAGSVLADLDYNEDSSCDVDMNFVITGGGNFVEVQGTAERAAFTKAHLDAMAASASIATDQVRRVQLEAMARAGLKL